MKVKCPYCGCEYKVDRDFLPNPIGNEKLGYGWWLRCFKCHKKWWLKNSEFEDYMQKELTAGRNDVLRKLSKLSKKNKKSSKEIKRKMFKKTFKYIIYTCIIIGSCLAYYNKDFFKNYINRKIERISSSIVMKMRMTDVKYLLENSENHDKITMIVSGRIINEDKTVLKIKGIKVSVWSEKNEEIASWTDTSNPGYIVSEDFMDFSIKHEIPKYEGSIRVDVSVM